MANTVVPSEKSRLKLDIGGVGSDLSNEREASSSNESMILFFEAGKCSLSPQEVGALERWVRPWNTPNSRCRLYVGGAEETSRANRLRRLSVLMSVLAGFGVNRKRIQIDADWLLPNRLGIIEDLPSDSMWLQVRGFHEPFAMPASEFGRQHRY